ncbi:chromosome partition protein MukE [Methylorubrum podarium]|jgi:chromosome condensin MukBEF MukE localization factor|uniref:chromosome partition protein MukE n=1 Tax=Methylorubrum podarium TaxID=200476 RepID=UPI002082164C|nr:chromosome partition protein MukE [Methylorubrum podarium]GJE72042.1 Chromosome partition protein MukE [Methylorubrum podarium]
MSAGSDFETLADAMRHPLFPRADVALRAGVHVTRTSDETLYEFLSLGHDVLSEHFARYGATLQHAPDGFYWLEPAGDPSACLLSIRHLSEGEMLVAIVVTVLTFDADRADEALASGGLITVAEILRTLEALGDQRQLMAVAGVRAPHNLTPQRIRGAVINHLRQIAAIGLVAFANDSREAVRTTEAIARLVHFAQRFAAQVGPDQKPRQGSAAPAEPIDPRREADDGR